MERRQMSSKCLKGDTDRIDHDKKRTSRKVGERKRATLFALPAVVKRWCGVALCSLRHRKDKETIHTSPLSVFKAASLFSPFLMHRQASSGSSALFCCCSLFTWVYDTSHIYTHRKGREWGRREERRRVLSFFHVFHLKRGRESDVWVVKWDV